MQLNRLLPFILAIVVTAGARAQSGPLVPESFRLSDAAQRAIGAAWLSDAERSELRAFHGVWEDGDLALPRAAAMVALNAWRFEDPAFDDPGVPVEMRAEARLRAGELDDAITILRPVDSIRAARIRAQAFEELGDYKAAGDALRPAVARLLDRRVEEAADLTDGVRALAIRARIEGQPARDYQSMMTLLGRAHQEMDRLYWPAKLAEAELLIDKHNAREAVAALHETLSLNPRCADAWYQLGRIALTRFDFDSANTAIKALHRVAPQHPLGQLLYAEARLVENDPEEAMDVLEGVIARLPRLRPAHALAAAASALLYDDEATAQALAEYERLSPGGAEAHYTAGRYLSMFRQYDDAAAMLEAAIERQPQWPAPRLELGLMEMQTGRDRKALAVLRSLIAIDPFNKRTANSLHLLEEIAEYDEIESEHFIIRYRPGIDEVLVALMPEPLDRIHDIVSARFGWEPEHKTIIEVAPNHKRFAVRITGMPHIHTIAACTGPIIAMEAPRDGPSSMHHGTFDWVRVLQHEYTHTITLDQTNNRIPHWLTEAAAVSMEPAPRDYDTAVMLARAYREGTLFDLDQIKWAFVRPKLRGDRGKAYAQGYWMVEYMNERFGPSALVNLLERYFEGDREEAAIPKTLGVSRDEFFRGFLAWAGEQVKAWGLAPEPTMLELTDELRDADPDLAVIMAASRKAWLDAISRAMADRIGAPTAPTDRKFTADQWPPLVRPPVEIDDDTLIAWRELYPDHPELLHEEIRRRLDARGEAHPGLIGKLERLAELRPVDDYPHRKLAQIYLAGDDPELAIPHLEMLDLYEEKSPIYARELANLYRDRGDRDRALAKVTRCVQVSPYVAEHRELAAAIALESGRLDLAHLHVKALTVLEPDRPQHAKRLARIEELMQ